MIIHKVYTLFLKSLNCQYIKFYTCFLFLFLFLSFVVYPSSLKKHIQNSSKSSVRKTKFLSGFCNNKSNKSFLPQKLNLRSFVIKSFIKLIYPISIFLLHWYITSTRPPTKNTRPITSALRY